MIIDVVFRALEDIIFGFFRAIFGGTKENIKKKQWFKRFLGTLRRHDYSI